MGKYTSDDIQRLAKRVRRARDDKHPFYLLTGAGCSISAGIPSSKDLIKEIHEKYREDCMQHLDDAELKDYGKCMECLAIDERRELLQPHLDNAKVNWAHIAIASMMEAGHLARVLTFNFDSVLAHACGLVGLYPATYDFAAAASDVTGYLATPAIVHLHGQGFALKMLNSTEETEQHAENLRPLFRSSFEAAPFLVVGYSGQSDAVFPVIKDAYARWQRMVWAGYEEEPDQHIQTFIKKGGNTAEYLGGADADPFLIRLAQALGCFPPQLFSDPYGHLLAELEPVNDFPVMDGGGPDILKNLRSKLMENQRIDQDPDKPDLEVLLMKGDWDAVVEHGDPEDAEQKDTIAWAYTMQGNALSDLAELKDDEPLYTQAIDKYKKATEIKPDKHEAYNNWGIALKNLAKLNDDEALYNQSFDKYKKATEIKLDFYAAYNNWGIALKNLAKLNDDPALYKQSFDKYKKATEIKPDKHEAYNNWGIALSDLAELKDDETLYTQSFDKYKKATEIKPDKQEAFYNWGNALKNLAELKDDEALYNQSFDKYKKATEIKLDDHEAYINWGSTLLELALLNGDRSLYPEAKKVLEQAETLNPDAVYNLACLLARTGAVEECREKLMRCKAAGTLPDREILLTDEDLESVRGMDWFQEVLA